ncbi:hypothetical protein Cgig2_017194 [Carnegiea gigantea]|uniref:Trichome birefringence-like C-terminal domain-containing protein n=1 Tax=Carnegiea gigantea TaxID=171969 RepID=A0A9Q1JU69_9CARY|nr:hypothetical protein Cgig2_017194 [Carnegiea gigantea]
MPRSKFSEQRWTSEENGVCEETDGLTAMELTMKTWAKWVDSNVDPLKKCVFFVTMSPTHFKDLYRYHKSQEWNPEKEGNCYGETKPIDDETYWGSTFDKQKMRMVEEILSRLGLKVTVINIMELSEYRKDAHPSSYCKFRGRKSATKWRNQSHILIVHIGACPVCLMYGISYSSSFCRKTSNI